jgi:hypothetical protein
VLLLSSCSTDKTSEIKIIDPRNFIEKKVALSELANSIRYIPLKNDILFSGIVSLQLCDSIIVAYTFPTGLFTFNLNGELLNRIGRKGNGPGEYKWGYMFTIDRSNRIIYVLVKTKILKYTMDGKFLEDIPINCSEKNFSEIVYSDNKLYLYEGINLGYGKYNWVIIDTLGNVKFSRFNFIDKFPSTQYLLGNKQESFNNRVYYWNQINDTIYRIENEKPSPEFLFAQGDFRFPKIWKIDYSEYFYPQKIFFTKDFLFLTYLYHSAYYTGLFSKKENKFYAINKSLDKSQFLGPGIYNDIDMGLPLVPLSYYCDKNQEEFVIGTVNSYQLKAHIASEAFKNSKPKYPEKKKELEKLANSLDENDNPVLMLVKLKE